MVPEQIQEMMQRLSNEADKSVHNSFELYKLLHKAVSVMALTLTHIGYLESKIDSITAENQRLSQIAKY